MNFDFIQAFFDPFVTLIIGIFTLLITRNSNRASVAKERLEKVYHPLFMKIEPWLYKDINRIDLEKFIAFFNCIQEEYSLYIYPSLRYAVGSLEDRIIKSSSKDFNEQWFLICDYICRDYDKLCRWAYMPVRSIAYRLNKNQFKKKAGMLCALLLLNLPFIIFATMILAFIFPPLVGAIYLMLIMYILYDYVL